MNAPCSTRMAFALLFTLTAGPASGQVQFKSPQPGDIYREYVHSMNGSSEYMVPDPNLDLVRYPQAAPFVPAPEVPILISDLVGAIRAEAVITYVGGHVSTTGQKMRFNRNAWMDIPILDTSNGIPAGHHGFNYLMLHNITMDIPLQQLFEGTNYFQGTSGPQIPAPVGYGFDWGQWGWYAMMVRIYYAPDKAHASGFIASHSAGGSMAENPTVAATITSGTAQQVDFLACYDDYDTDGDGIYLQYHHDYMVEKYQEGLTIKNHVGTATSAPWSVNWNTAWVPDQPAGQVKLIARIRDNNDIWYVTPEVTQLSLVRTGTSVKLYKPLDIPERCWAKGDVGVQTIHVNIPPSDNLPDATAAQYHIRTWNGANVITEPGDTEYRRFNGWTDDKFGADHHYTYDIRPIPLNVLLSGTNTFDWFTTNYLHHAIEILWPGPAVSVRYTGNYASPIPGMASLASPPDHATNQLTTLTLRWHPALVAASYEVQLSTDSLFSSLQAQITNVTDTSVQVGPLINQTTYFWRVRATNAAGSTPFAGAWSFRTFLGSPALKSPPNNAVRRPIAPVLSWNTVATATMYRLQVSRDSAFTPGQLLRDTTLTDTTISPAGLPYNTQCFWHVAARSGGQWGTYSSVWAFTTTLAPAGIPALLMPANNSADQPVNVLLRWRLAASTDSYQLQLGSDSAFAGSLVVNDSTIADTVKPLSSLAYDTRYYWRVRGKNAVGSSAFSQVWNFRTVMSVPVGPLLLSPANGATGAPTTGLVFTWRSIPGAANYRFQMGTDSSFASGIIKNDSSLVDTSRVVNGLAVSTKHFWRVSGRNAGGAGPYSPTWSLVTLIPVPGVVSLVAPVHLTNIFADSALFRWNRTSPASTRYWFQISVDSTFGTLYTVDSTLADTTKLLRSLQYNSSYYWRVRGGNAGGWGAFSTVRKLSVSPASSTADPDAPRAFTLSQNFPNPFNPTTIVNFQLPVAGWVRLAVYDMLGREVAVLVNETREPGSYAVTWNASGMASGVYLYRIQSGTSVLSRKMALMK